MNPFDVAHIYDEPLLRIMIDQVKEERDFWFSLLETFPESDCVKYYKDQYVRYNDRLRDLRNLLKEITCDG